MPERLTLAPGVEVPAPEDGSVLRYSGEAVQDVLDFFSLLCFAQNEWAGKPFELLYSLYAAAMKVSNQYINISELHEYQDAATLIASFREYGVEAFTVSSGWSSATESAWAFLQNGCTLAGMVEINGPHKAFGSDE